MIKLVFQLGRESEEERIYKECIKLIDKAALTKDESERSKLIDLILAKMKRLPAEKRIELRKYAKDLGVGL